MEHIPLILSQSIDQVQHQCSVEPPQHLFPWEYSAQQTQLANKTTTTIIWIFLHIYTFNTHIQQLGLGITKAVLLHIRNATTDPHLAQQQQQQPLPLL